MANRPVLTIAAVCVILTTIGVASTSAQDCIGAQVMSVGFSSAVSLAPATDHEATLLISAPAGCGWSVISNSPIMTVAPAGGSGNAQVSVNLAPNPGDGRSGSVSVFFSTGTARHFTMVQRGCLSVLSRPDLSQVFPGYSLTHIVSANGGVRYARVDPASAVCEWSAMSTAPWVTIGAIGSAPGPGSVRYVVEPNTSGAVREATFSVGYLTFRVRQQAKFTGDLNGDAFADLLWHHQATGAISTWLMRATTLLDGRLLQPAQVPEIAWKVVGSADLTEDGHPDLVWQHDDGRIALWQMEGTSLVRGYAITHSFFPPDPSWRVEAIGDLNSDGHPDIIQRHTTTGAIRAWLLFRGSFLFDATFSPSQVPDATWRIAAAADFNADGQIDLLWHNVSTGMVSVWTLTWAGVAPSTTWSVTAGMLLNPGQVGDTNWKVRGAADVNRDGHPDLLWQNESNGLISVWLMRGIDLVDGRLFSPGQVTDTNWRIVGPR